VAPYSPFAQIIKEGLRLATEKRLDIPDAVLADLLSLVPDLQSSYPQIRPNPQLEPASEQQRLFASVEEYICSFSQITPLLLIIEDVHWADSASLSLIRHLARTLGSYRICLLPSHREIELDPGHPLQQMLQDFTRERIATHLELARLTLAETGALLEVILQGQTSPDFLEGIYRHTEGNPFFVEEVCKALVQEGRLYYEQGRWHHPSMDQLQIPQSVRIAIESQVAKLPQEAQETLCLAAVFGREFDFDILVEASADDGQTLTDAVEAAERAQLIEDVSSNGSISYAFVHALIPSTLRESMAAPRRRQLQRRAAEAIESIRPDEFEELARLYSLSGEDQKALTYHTRAGERAYLLYANQEAIEQFCRAVEIAKRLPASDDDIVHLYARLGRTYEVCGQYDDALTYYTELEARGREQGHPALELAGMLAQVTVFSIPSAKWDPARAEELANKALNLARKLKDHRAESKAYWNLMFIENYWERDLDAAVSYGEQSLAIARKHELPAEQAYALHDLAPVYCQLGEANRALTAWEESRQLWRRMGDKAMLADNLTSASGVLAYTGEVDQAQAFAEEALELSRSIHNLWGQSYSLVMLGWLLLQLGDMSGAIDALEESHPIAHRVEFSSAANVAIGLLADAFRRFGQPGRASELVEHALANSSEGAPYCALPLRLSAVLQAERGEKEAAIHTLQQAQEMGLQARAEPMAVAFSAQMEIEVMLILGEYDSALRLAESFMSHLRRTQMQLLEPEALLKKAQALRGLGRLDQARPALSTGQQQAQRLNLLVAHMDLLVERFELESQAGNSSRAESARRAASTAVTKLADQVGEGSLRDGFLNLARVRAVMHT
jgi:tetratricopeptide (TPR) repeat protein